MPVNILWKQHDAKVKPYHRAHRIVDWSRTLLGLGLLVWFIRSGEAHRLEWVLSSQIANHYLLWLAFFGLVGAVWEMISLPFSYAGYRIEKAWNLSRQSLGSWFADKAKGWALMLVFGAIAMGLVYVSILWGGDRWWMLTVAFFLVFSIGLAQLAPVLLIPLFFPMKPMDPSSLKERLFALCKKFSVDVKDVYHLGLGEKTEKGNAAFVGLGRTKRILIGDTLYEKFSADEVEAVFAHELGHQVHNDLWKGIGFSTVLSVVAFWGANTLAEAWVFPYFQTSVDRPFGLLLFFITLSILQMPLGVLQTLFSRAREWAADRFASETTKLGAPLADALERLTVQNYGLYYPNRLVEFLTHSHPAPAKRISRLRP